MGAENQPALIPEKSIAASPQVVLEPNRYNVAFLIMNGTYNTEFTAPYDIFQHTQYRDGHQGNEYVYRCQYKRSYPNF